MTVDKRKILVTGAAGLVGSILRTHWKDRYSLRLVDLKRLTDIAHHEEVAKADITDLAALTKICEGVDTVVHLAAYPGDGSEFYNTLLNLNIIGAYNVFEAAREAGCRRLVFASSIDVVMGYQSCTRVKWDAPVYPTNIYGATKCWGEALGRVYADRNGLSVIAVRLTSPTFDQSGNWESSELWSCISPRDCATLFAQCVEVENIDFAIVHGISEHHRPRLDPGISQRVLGFCAQDGTSFPKTTRDN